MMEEQIIHSTSDSRTSHFSSVCSLDNSPFLQGTGRDQKNFGKHHLESVLN
jgi:hypothetical protein